MSLRLRVRIATLQMETDLGRQVKSLWTSDGGINRNVVSGRFRSTAVPKNRTYVSLSHHHPDDRHSCVTRNVGVLCPPRSFL
ncbi:hypothetical protein V22_40730 [Calycomorphotria hydatis]|uniref:Uncharacterized protein n=1 Tax=Calycomorphotria hydatis TaxID=2528027 RepID=A0A517TEK5_9PLAN|nr:hypothetical protein V22_40730 [Calycomorphotria hydatis]